VTCVKIKLISLPVYSLEVARITWEMRSVSVTNRTYFRTCICILELGYWIWIVHSQAVQIVHVSLFWLSDPFHCFTIKPSFLDFIFHLLGHKHAACPPIFGPGVTLQLTNSCFPIFGTCCPSPRNVDVLEFDNLSQWMFLIVITWKAWIPRRKWTSS